MIIDKQINKNIPKVKNIFKNNASKVITNDPIIFSAVCFYINDAKIRQIKKHHEVSNKK